MKLFKNYLLLFALIILASCSSNGNSDILNYTLNNTLGVSRVNLNTISKKIPAEKILKEKKNIKENERLMLQLISKPKESGMDMDSPLYVMVDQSEQKKGLEYKLIFNITDKAKFQTTMSTISKSKITINDKDFILKDGVIIGSLNKKLAVIIQNDDSGFYNSYSQGSSSKALTEVDIKNFWNRKGTDNKTIKEQINKSLSSDKDLSAWMNIGAIASYVSKGYIETLAVFSLIKDSGYNVNLNFEKGSVDMETRSFFNDGLKKVVTKYYKGKDINYDLVKNVELDHSKTFSLGFFSLDLVSYIIKEAGLEATINNYLGYAGTTVNDITTTFNGDFAIVETLPNAKQDNAYNSSKPSIILGVNKNATEKLKVFLQNPILANVKNIYQDNQILFSENLETANQFKNRIKAKNSILDKKSNVIFNTWSNGDDFGITKQDVVKITNIKGDGKMDDGDMISKSKIEISKKDENALYYFILSND